MNGALGGRGWSGRWAMGSGKQSGKGGLESIKKKRERERLSKGG